MIVVIFGVVTLAFLLSYVVPGDPGIPSTLSPAQYKNFAPRVGIAYSPHFKNGVTRRDVGRHLKPKGAGRKRSRAYRRGTCSLEYQGDGPGPDAAPEGGG